MTGSNWVMDWLRRVRGPGGVFPNGPDAFDLRAIASDPPRADSRLYYECHVTIEPLDDKKRAQAGDLARAYGFRLADLLMQKRHADTPERSKHDTFMTGRSKNYADLQRRMRQLITALRRAGFVVWRAKIEDTLYDTKCGDKWP